MPDTNLVPDRPGLTEKRRWTTHVLGVVFQTAEPDETRAKRGMARAMIETAMADLATLRTASPEAATRLQAAFNAAVTTARGGDLDAALRMLDACTTEIGQAMRTARQQEATTIIPAGIVKNTVAALEQARIRWETARLRSIDGLDDLVAQLFQQDDIELHEIADRIHHLTREMPDSIEASLHDLAQAVEAGDTALIKTAAGGIETMLDHAGGFLTEYADEIAACEDNPWKIPVAIADPVWAAIEGIEAALRSIRR